MWWGGRGGRLPPGLVKMAENKYIYSARVADAACVASGIHLTKVLHPIRRADVTGVSDVV